MTKLILILTLLTGCSTFDKFRNMKKPIVELETVDVKNVDMKGAQLIFRLQVQNPNDFALKVDAVKYQIDIGGKTMSTESIDTPTEVGANTTGEVQLPLTVAFADIFTSIGSFLRNEKTSYRLKGQAKVGILSLPFDESGGLKFQDGEIKHFKE